MKKVAIISHDLSHNCVGSAFFMAQAVMPHCKAHIYGFTETGTIWPPLSKQNKVAITSTPTYHSLATELDSFCPDVILAIKPRFRSYGFALRYAKKHYITLLLHVDDWEIGFFKEWSYVQCAMSILKFWEPNGVILTILSSYASRYADGVLANSNFLQQKYPGSFRIGQFKDPQLFTHLLDPQKLKKQLGLPFNRPIVVFAGTPRSHKGIDILKQALSLFHSSKPLLLIIGAEREKKSAHVHEIPTVDFFEMPSYVNLADIIVLPQKKTPASVGQIPAKLIDAMALGKPIISTQVSDIPEILEGCGIVVPPDDPQSLYQAIQKLMNNPKLASKLGDNARKKFLKEFTTEAAFRKIRPLLND